MPVCKPIDMCSQNQKSQATITTSVKKKLNALENILHYIKTNGHSEPKHLMKSKQKALKLFSKMLKIIRNLETGKYENINTICHKKLPKLLMDLKTKSLFYHLEALFVENLRNSMFDVSKSLKPESTNQTNNYNSSSMDLTPNLSSFKCKSTRLISLKKSESGNFEKQLLLDEIDRYVRHFLIHIGVLKIQKLIIGEIVDEQVTNCEQNWNIKHKLISFQLDFKNSSIFVNSPSGLDKKDLDSFQQYSSSNNNSSELTKPLNQIKLKTCTTFLYYNNDHSNDDDLKTIRSSSSVKNYVLNCKKRNIYLKIKDMKEKCEYKISSLTKSSNYEHLNKENVDINKTIDEISSKTLKFELPLKEENLAGNNLTDSQYLGYKRIENINNITHSISDIHILKPANLMDKTINSNFSLSPTYINDSVYDSSMEITKIENQTPRPNFTYHSPKNNRCARIINSAIQSARLTRARSEIVLKFVLSAEEMAVSVTSLENISNYETRSFMNGNSCSHFMVCINWSNLSNLSSSLLHEYKIKRCRIIKQIVMVPNIVYNYLYDINLKKDHRILHIEKFCGCQISLKNKFDFNDNFNCPSKSNILISIIYDIEKGNEIGCVNMIKRMLNIFNYQVKIIREFKVTVEGIFEETFYK